MDLKTLIGGRDAILKDMTGALTAHGFDPSLAERPITLQQARIDALKARIDTLAQAKRDQAARIDATIADLTAEITGLQTRLESDKARLAPVLKAATVKAKTTTAKATTAKTTPTTKPRRRGTG